METRNNKRKVLTGVVVSDKMMKTRVVQVQTSSRHPQYGKLLKHVIRYKAHDEKNESHVGDLVNLMETRPISKDKRWIITEIIGKVETEEAVL
jgi:small subunit ribosomal protein S17